MIQPRPQTAGRRREMRRRIRNILGPSSDAAPDAIDALRAAQEMAELVDYATNGRYAIQLIDMQSESTTWEGARNVARGLHPSGAQR